MKSRKLILILFALPFVWACPRQKACDRQFNLIYDATVTETNDTLHIGDSITLSILIPQDIKDKQTGQILHIPSEKNPDINILLFNCLNDTITSPAMQKNIFDANHCSVKIGSIISSHIVTTFLNDTFRYKMRMAIVDTGRMALALSSMIYNKPGIEINNDKSTGCRDYLLTELTKFNNGENHFELLQKFMRLTINSGNTFRDESTRYGYYSFVVIP